VGAIMDPMGNAFHAVLTADVQGSSVFVVGCGPIGCFAVGIARAAGATTVIASDVNEKRLALARRMGAHVTINAATDDVVRTVLDATGGEGADVVCEMSGVPSALHQAFAAVRLGGRVQLLGIPNGEVPVDFASEIIFKGVTVHGVIGRRMYETWHQMRRYLTAGLLDPRPVITHQFPLARFVGCESSLTYVSCWNANEGLCPTLLGEQDIVISDQLNHASIIDSIRLAKTITKCQTAVYRHSDMADLRDKLRAAKDARLK